MKRRKRFKKINIWTLKTPNRQLLVSAITSLLFMTLIVVTENLDSSYILISAILPYIAGFLASWKKESYYEEE